MFLVGAAAISWPFSAQILLAFWTLREHAAGPPTAWGLGLGARLGSARMAAFAVGVWLVTVLAAYMWERAGRPGPAEALLRRLVYVRVRSR